ARGGHLAEDDPPASEDVAQPREHRFPAGDMEGPQALAADALVRECDLGRAIPLDELNGHLAVKLPQVVEAIPEIFAVWKRFNTLELLDRWHLPAEGEDQPLRALDL